MAQKNPFREQDAVRSIRLPIVGTVQNRAADSLKDQRFINLFPETITNPTDASLKDKSMWLVKRPGLVLRSSVVPGGAEGRGSFFWNGHEYTVFGDTLYRDGVSIQTLTTSSGNVGFAECTGTTRYLFLCDGTEGYSITTSGTCTKIKRTAGEFTAWQATYDYALGDIVIPTVPNGKYYIVSVDAGSSGAAEPTWPTIKGTTVVNGGITFQCAGSYSFPSPHIPTPVFMDGYVFLAVPDDVVVYNCDLEDVVSWDSTSYLEAIMFPDNIVSLGRQNNQLVVMGRMSTEFFYNAANSTGSPLQRTDHAIIQFGCAAAYSVFQNEKYMIYVGASDSGGRAVWMLDGFTPKKISYEGIEKILDAEGTTITEAKGFGIRTNGHFFYLLNLETLGRTLLFDLEEKMWHEWSSNNSGAHTNFAISGVLDSLEGYISIQHPTNGCLYDLKPTVTNDDGTSIICEYVSQKADFGVNIRKFLSCLTVIGDLTTLADNFQIRWSDDDYNTWSSWKTVNATSRPIFNRLGVFRRRAFNIKYTGDHMMRIEALEIQVELGVS